MIAGFVLGVGMITQCRVLTLNYDVGTVLCQYQQPLGAINDTCRRNQCPNRKA
jgi:hypothetical protein